MKTLKLIGMVPMVLLAATSFAQGSDDRAVPRSGSDSSVTAGSRHSGGGSSSSSSATQGSGSSDRSRATAPSGRSNSESSAQAAARRRPQPGTGTGDRGRYGNNRSRYYGSPYSYYYYDPYAYSWGYPRSQYGYGYGYYDYGFSYGDYYGYYPSSSYRTYRYRSGNVAQLRTLVEPKKARVYVDGYYAGLVDDFDGLLQRLNVSPGRHDITFKLEGFNSHTFAVYANRDQTLKIRWEMVKGNGDTRDTSVDNLGPLPDQGDQPDRDFDRDRDLDRDPDDNQAEDGREVDSDRRFEAPNREVGRGELLLDVQPEDASVYVDGEFYGKASQITRLDLPAGRHRVEVVRPGYRTVEKEVDIDRDPARITVTLDRR